MKINRREFLGRTMLAAAAAAGAGAAGLANLRADTGQADTGQAGEGASIPIIDTHQHLWDLDKIRLPWLKTAGPLNRSHRLADYLEAVAGLGVVKSVYMEVDVEAADRPAEARYIVGLCKEGKGIPCAAVIGGDPGSEGFGEYIAAFKGSGYVKGVRRIPSGGDGQGHPFARKEFVAGVRRLGELGMSFDLCAPARDLGLCAKLADQCPQTRFVLDHCGNADPKAFASARAGTGARARAESRPAEHDADSWRRDMTALAARKNVVCKISGIVARADKSTWSADDLAPIVNHCLDAFGPDRVVFGSDWPVCTLVATCRQWVQALKEIISSRTPTDRKKLLHDNAARFYGLT